MIEIVDTKARFDETINVRRVLGSQVVSKRGILVGKVAHIQVDTTTFDLQGIVVTRGLLKQPIYIAREYIDKLSSDAVLLTIDPSILLIGRTVRLFDGTTIGKIHEVVRDGTTNIVREIIIKPLLRKPIHIAAKHIKSFGNDTILLNEQYER